MTAHFIKNPNTYQQNVTKDAELRYKELLDRNLRSSLVVIQQKVASFLNIAPETRSYRNPDHWFK